MNHVPKRPRKYCTAGISKLDTKTGERDDSRTPVHLLQKGIAKVELSVAKGRKTFDKREAIKKQDAKRKSNGRCGGGD